MSWHREWQAIEESIAELTGICGEFVAALDAKGSDAMGTMTKVILPMAKRITQNISLLGDRYRSQLPEVAVQKIEMLVNSFEKNSEMSSTVKAQPTSTSFFSSLFRQFRAEFNYLTSDLDGVTVRLTARAFTHLQRSIVADNSFRERWQEAFKKGETSCERLGGIHLLYHGIWCFKVDAGERTDLILGEPLRDDDLHEVYLTAEGLVLTEWKCATRDNSKQKYKEAKKQAELYAGGSLAAIELKKYRYLVIVSKELLTDLPSEIEEDELVYKYINIAVAPLQPSVQARKGPSANTNR